MSDDLRQRYADAIDKRLHAATLIKTVTAPQQAHNSLTPSMLDLADAVLAVRDEEMLDLRMRSLALIAAAEDRAEQAEAAIKRVRRLCDLTINASVRTDAIQQARDTLGALDGTGAAHP